MMMNFIKTQNQFIMKITYLFLVSFFYHYSYGQDMRDGRHIFNYDVSLEKCNYDGTPITPTVFERVQANTIFLIRNIVGSDYIIHIAKFTGETPKAIALNSRLYQNPQNNDIFLDYQKLITS